MARIAWLCALALTTLHCDGLFPMDMAPPPTVAYLLPTVSFAAAFDCSAGNPAPLTVTWSVKPVMLQSGGQGISSSFSATESLQPNGGTTTECYFTSAGISQSSGSGLAPGLWQISLAHNLPGYTNPLVCTRNLALGNNSMSFVFGVQGANCQ